jgi:hypothetical protein
MDKKGKRKGKQVILYMSDITRDMLKILAAYDPNGTQSSVIRFLIFQAYANLIKEQGGVSAVRDELARIQEEKERRGLV